MPRKKLTRIAAYVACFLFILLLVICTTESDYFIYRSLTPLLLLFLVLPLGLLSIMLLVLARGGVKCIANFPVLAILGLLIYWVFSGLNNGNRFSPYSQYVIYCFMGMLFISVLMKLISSFRNQVMITICLLAAMESLWCLSETLGLITGPSMQFKVSGNQDNPNVTAMFLTLSIPAFLALFNKSQNRKLLAWGLGLIILEVFILNCRSAWIGTITILLVYAELKFHLMARVKGLSLFNKIAAAFATLICITILSVCLYSFKASSSSGRIFIWKISLQMIARSPVIGCGYGGFEQAYNLAQGSYFAAGKYSASERLNASHVYMAYNEYLQNAVEGGLPGLILFGLALFSLLSIPVFKRRTDSYLIASWTAVLTFSVMSVVNFTLQAIPVMGLFIFYGSLLISDSIQVNLLHKSSKPYFKIAPLLAGVLIILFSYLSWYGITLLKANYINKQMASTNLNTSPEPDLVTLDRLQSTLDNYESYWVNYGNLLVKKRRFAEAVLKFRRATQLSSNPVIYFQMGKCYEAINHPKAAINCYTQATLIEPIRLQSRYALMSLYRRQHDSLKAGTMANEIIELPVKVPSALASKYINEAQAYLNTLNPQK